MDSTQQSCPQCSAPVTATQNFCGSCGARLTPSQQAAPSAVSFPPGAPPAPGVAPPPPPPGSAAYPPGYLPYYYPPPASETPDATGGLIPYKNPHALIAYYCAVFALIPGIGLILGPLALGMGISGWRYYRRHPVAKGAVHAWIGIILGGLCALFNVAWIVVMFLGIPGGWA